MMMCEDSHVRKQFVTFGSSDHRSEVWKWITLTSGRGGRGLDRGEGGGWISRLSVKAQAHSSLHLTLPLTANVTFLFFQHHGTLPTIVEWRCPQMHDAMNNSSDSQRSSGQLSSIRTSLQYNQYLCASNIHVSI